MTNARWMLAAAAAVATAVLVSPASAQVSPEAKAILDESTAALKKAEGLQFSSKVYATGMEMLASLLDVTGDVKVMRVANAPEPMVLVNGRMKDPGNPDRQIVLATDGTVARWLDHKQNKLMERPMSESREAMSNRAMLVPDEILKADFSSLTSMGAQGTVTKKGIDNVNGEVCDVIVGEPTDKSRQIIWYISATDRLPRRREQRTEQGELKVSMLVDFSNVKTTTLAAKDFDIPLPTGFVRDVPVQAPTAPVSGLPAEPAVQLGLKVGAAAPDFKAVDASGKEHTLASFAGNVVVMEFWGSMFKKSMAAHTDMQAIADQFKGKNVAVVSFACRELDPEAAKKHWADSKLSYTLVPKGDDVAKAFNVVGYPTYYVLGTDGKVAAFFQDFPGKDALAAAVTAAGAK